MTTTGKTRAELAAWLDRWNEDGAAPSAEAVHAKSTLFKCGADTCSMLADGRSLTTSPSSVSPWPSARPFSTVMPPIRISQATSAWAKLPGAL